MSVNLTVNNLVFAYPQNGDEAWGLSATGWAIAVTNLLAQMRSASSPFATIGTLRLGSQDSIAWRNFANNENVRIFVDVDDKLYYQNGANPVIDLSSNANGNVTGPLTSTDNALPRFDGITGQNIQDSGVILSDLDAMSGLTSVDSLAYLIGGVAITEFFIDVIGSSTDNALSRWDGITGKQVQNSTVLLSDVGVMTGLASLDTLALLIGGTPITDLFIDQIGLSTDNAVTRWDGVTGKQVQNSLVTISDTGDIVIPGNVTISGAGVSSVSEQFANEVFEEYARPTGNIVGLRGVAVSDDITQSRTSTNYGEVTDSEITLTTSGRPVMIMLVSTAANADDSFIAVEDLAPTTGDEASGTIRLVRDMTEIATWPIKIFASPGSTDLYMQIPPTSITHLDIVAAGTYDYILEFKTLSTSNTIYINDCRLIAYEL